MFSRVKQLGRMVFGRSALSRWLFFSPGQRKYWRKVGDGSASSVVMAPLLWIGRNFPEAPPALWRKMPDSGEEERVTGEGDLGGEHRMIELLGRPNEYYSGPILWMATIIDYHLTGDGYWLKIRDVGGRPRELWWTPSALMTPKGDERTFITHYEYRPGTEPIRVDPSDVVHFRYSLDPEDPRKGKSPLSSLLHEVFTDTEAANFTAALLSNMGVPGVVVSPKDASAGEPGPEDVKATKEFFKEGFTGDRRGEPLVMSGPTRVEQFGFSPQQMTLRELRRIPEERVSAVIGLPAIVAGLGAGLDRSTFANYAEAREAAYQDNIIPAQRIFSEDVKYQLLPDFEPDSFHSFRFGFDLSNVRVLQEDRNALAERFDVGIRGGWVRVSEGRRALDLEVDDADEVYLRGAMTIEIPVGGAPAPAPPQLSPGQPAQLAPGEAPPALPPGEPAPATSMRKMKVERWQSRLVHALLRDAHVLSGQFASELEEDFVSFGEDCATTFIEMAPSQASRSNGHAKERKEFDAQILARMIAATLSVSFDEKLRKRFERNTMRVLEQTLSTIGSVANLTSGVSDQVQRAILLEGGKRRGMLDIEKTTRDSLFRVINSGNELGLNPREMARNIRSEVPAGRYINAGPSYRSQLISRTETNWAQNTSSIAYYREAEEVDRVVALDGSDDPECAERDGQEFSFDEAEQELQNEHPNGTLAFAPVVREMQGAPA